ncbi:MAG TPA: hypothetical protein VMW87_05945 [Spirochaetia bacterium]|nr:hypothetical protein [Spirochaetia bacterium]
MRQAEREDRWRTICREFRDGGMTRRAFCESRTIALSTLGYWLKRLSVLTSSRQSSAFVPMGTVEISPRAVLRIRLGGEVIAELDLPAEQSVIREVMRAAASL